MILWNHKDEFRQYLKIKYPFAKVEFLGEDVNNKLLVFTVGYEPKDSRLADLRLTFGEKDIKTLRKQKLKKLNEKISSS